MGQATGRENPKRRVGFPHAAWALALAAALLAACASPRPAQTFRFASNRAPVDALRCASNRLRLEGFQVTSSLDTLAAVSTPADSLSLPDSLVLPDSLPRVDSLLPGDSLPQTALPGLDSPFSGRSPQPPPAIPIEQLSSMGLRRTDSDTVEKREWWRVELSISQSEDGTTLVHSLAGVSTRPEGPFEEPSMPLQALIGKLTLSCTW
jgi:hypothetical protein